MPRTAPGNDCRQRPHTQEVKELSEYQEDGIYHEYEVLLMYRMYLAKALCYITSYPLVCLQVGRIWCECIRPNVHHTSDNRWGGYDYVTLRYAGTLEDISMHTFSSFSHACPAALNHARSCACSSKSTISPRLRHQILPSPQDYMSLLFPLARTAVPGARFLEK